MESILFHIAISLFCFLLGIVVALVFYTKIIKQIQRTIAEIKGEVAKVV